MVKLVPPLFNSMFQVGLAVYGNEMSGGVMVGLSLLAFPGIYWIGGAKNSYRAVEEHSDFDI